MYKIAILGYGGRGRLYGLYIKHHPKEFEVIAVIDNNSDKLKLAAKDLNGKPLLFDNLDDFLLKGKIADYLFICTQDRDHYEHSIKAMDTGYNLLLEKPIATSMEDCIKIERKAKEKNIKIGVCHVLRYSIYYDKIKEILDSGVLGKIISIEQIENVGFWHQAHSFVRGDWGNSEQSNPMILAKCCHDLDLAVYLADSKCKSVVSVGKLNFFNKENCPEGATEYCLNGCAVKDKCPYDCEKLYITKVPIMSGIKNLKHILPPVYKNFWPHSRLMSDSAVTVPKLYDALKTSQFGKCVFMSDNDVVDYQNVIMTFENGITSTLTMTAFNAGKSYRQTRIRGTLGELDANMGENKMYLKLFNEKPKRIFYGLGLDAHGGGDGKMLHMLAEDKLRTDISMSIESHLIGFLAEKSRLEDGQVQYLEEYRK